MRAVVEPLEPRVLYSADPFGASQTLLGYAEVRSASDPAPAVVRTELVIVDERV